MRKNDGTLKLAAASGSVSHQGKHYDLTLPRRRGRCNPGLADAADPCCDIEHLGSGREGASADDVGAGPCLAQAGTHLALDRLRCSFSSGDIVGCGVLSVSGDSTVFYTINGSLGGFLPAEVLPSTSAPLYGMAATAVPDQVLVFNYGDRPFVFSSASLLFALDLWRSGRPLPGSAEACAPFTGVDAAPEQALVEASALAAASASVQDQGLTRHNHVVKVPDDTHCGGVGSAAAAAQEGPSATDLEWKITGAYGGDKQIAACKVQGNAAHSCKAADTPADRGQGADGAEELEVQVMKLRRLLARAEADKQTTEMLCNLRSEECARLEQLVTQQQAQIASREMNLSDLCTTPARTALLSTMHRLRTSARQSRHNGARGDVSRVPVDEEAEYQDVDLLDASVTRALESERQQVDGIDKGEEERLKPISLALSFAEDDGSESECARDRAVEPGVAPSRDLLREPAESCRGGLSRTWLEGLDNAALDELSSITSRLEGQVSGLIYRLVNDEYKQLTERRADRPARDETSAPEDELAHCQRENKRLKRELKTTCADKIRLQAQVRAARREQESRDMQEVAGACGSCMLCVGGKKDLACDAAAAVGCLCDEMVHLHHEMVHLHRLAT